MGRRTRAGLLSAAIFIVVGLAGPALAQKEPPEEPPALSIVAPAEPTLTVEDGDDARTGEVTVLLTTTADATGVKLFLFVDDGPAVRSKRVEFAGSDRKFRGDIPAGKVVALDARFELDQDEVPREAILKVQSGDLLAQQVVTELTIERPFDESVLGNPVIWGITGALLVLAVTLWRARKEHPTTPHRASGKGGQEGGNKRLPKMKDPVHTDKAWSFSDSWATNITVIGALLTTVLQATDVLSEVLPGISLNRFLGLSLLFGAIATGAPLVYIALGRREPLEADGKKTMVTKGTVGGLLAAAALTSFAVFGQLRTVALLVELSETPRFVEGVLLGLLAVAGALVLLYAIRSLGWMFKGTEEIPAGRSLSAAAGPGVPAAGAL